MIMYSSQSFCRNCSDKNITFLIQFKLPAPSHIVSHQVLPPSSYLPIHSLLCLPLLLSIGMTYNLRSSGFLVTLFLLYPNIILETTGRLVPISVFQRISYRRLFLGDCQSRLCPDPCSCLLLTNSAPLIHSLQPCPSHICCSCPFLPQGTTTMRPCCIRLILKV